MQDMGASLRDRAAGLTASAASASSRSSIPSAGELSENQRIDLVIAELTALKAANEAGDTFEQCRRQYWAARSVSHLFQDDDMAAVADSAATEMEREFRWDVEMDRPAFGEAV